ncbi:MAG TPA: mucoidy inhibitor MuiA family protein [Planctomycetota bacterium]|nr:mucoidy inhibitor MuiA family protein [Planctomycetota bacterium]
MCQKKNVLAAVAAVACLATGAFAGEMVKGKIEAVTLYRGQALVTRLVSVNAPAGASQVVVGELPEQIVSDSLYARSEDGVQVRAVRYRTNAIGEAPRDEVRAIDESIEATEAEMRKTDDLLKTAVAQAAFLGKLENFTAPTAQVELSKGVLNANTLRELTLFMFDQSAKQADTAFKLNEKIRQLKKQIELHRAKRAELTKGSSRVERQAVIFIERAEAGATRLRLNYLVHSATWSPAYNLRSGGEMKTVQVEYNALVQQMSGENWDDVTLTLSTASPTMVSDPPVLAPLLVALAPADAGRQAGAADLEQLKNKVAQAKNVQREAESRRNTSLELRSQIDNNWLMNAASNDLQGVEFTISGDQARMVREVQRRSAGLSVNYKLTGPASLASRADQQMVRIADLAMSATFVNVAVPLLSESVYRQAEIVNNSETALLEGRCSVYLGGDFVGNGIVPIVARGQKFVAGFGTDPQLRAWRELISRTESVQGGNREVLFRYRLVLDNYKDVPATMRSFDRLPFTQSDVRVTMDETKDPLSTDAEYNRAFRPNGILRWDVEVPAHSAAATARIVEYGFKVEHDRNMMLTVPSSGEKAAAAKEMFEQQMQR